jgi:threonine/homoserine/homoserine lactone efflux protein
MMSPENLLALATFAFVSSITPGPNNLMLMASGINFGFVRTIPHMLGVSLGFVLLAVVVGLGLGQVFTRFPVMHTVLLVVSVIYLVWLAWKIANAAPPASANRSSSAKPMSFLAAALFQWVNPKAWTMAITAMTTFVPPEAPVMSLLIVAGLFALINLPSVGCWTVLGVQMRRLLDDPKALRVFNITAALLLLASLWPTVMGAIGQ